MAQLRLVGCSFELAGVREGPVRLGVRPDDGRLPNELLHDHAVGKVHASVEVIELLGPSAVLYLDVEGRELRAVVSDTQADDLYENDRVEVAFDQRRLHIFDPETGERVNALPRSGGCVRARYSPWSA